MPHITVDIKTCCSRQSSTDMYVIYIFEYISSSFFHEIFKSNIVFTNVPFSVQTKDAWSLCTCAVCATGHLLLHPNQSPGQYLWFLLTASTLKVFCAGKFLRLSKPNWSVQTFWALHTHCASMEQNLCGCVLEGDFWRLPWRWYLHSTYEQKGYTGRN